MLGNTPKGTCLSDVLCSLPLDSIKLSIRCKTSAHLMVLGLTRGSVWGFRVKRDGKGNKTHLPPRRYHSGDITDSQSSMHLPSPPSPAYVEHSAHLGTRQSCCTVSAPGEGRCTECCRKMTRRTSSWSASPPRRWSNTRSTGTTPPPRGHLLGLEQKVRMWHPWYLDLQGSAFQVTLQQLLAICEAVRCVPRVVWQEGCKGSCEKMWRLARG